MHIKVNHRQNEKTTDRMGENICKWCNQQETSLQNLQQIMLLSSKKKKTAIKKWTKDLSIHFSKDNKYFYLLDFLSLFSSVQSLTHVRLFATSWTAAFQASLSIANSQSLLKLMSIELIMPSNHLILCHPFSSCLQSFPASGSFPVSKFFVSCNQNIVTSALVSVLLMNIQDRFPLGWTGLISLLSKGLSRVFSNNTVQKHQFFST